MADFPLVRSRRCRRSDLIVGALQAHSIPFRLVAAESDEGRTLITEYDRRASPGILVDGRSVNPFDLVHDCRVDDGAVRHHLLGEEASNGSDQHTEAVSGPGLAAGP